MKQLVCIGFSEALSAPEVTWSLVDAGFEVIALARKGRHSALRHSSHVTVLDVTPPETDYEATLSEIELLIEWRRPLAGQRGVLFPLDDTALWLFSKLQAADGWTNAGARGAPAAFALDKRLQIDAARAAGLNIPATTIAANADGVRARLPELPLVLRPADAILPESGRLRKGRNWICATPEELEHAVADWGGKWPIIVQPYIHGMGEGIFGFSTQEGIVAWSGHRRLRMMNPHGSGSSACASRAVSEDLKPRVEKFLRQPGWQGMFMVELLRDDAGTSWFVEFNGRPWGSMALARRQGFEYPAWAVEQAINPNAALRFATSREEEIVCRSAGRELMHLLFVLRGPKSEALHDWPSFWRTTFDLLRPHANGRFYNWRPDDPKVFFSDWWYTVYDNIFKAKSSI